MSQYMDDLLEQLKDAVLEGDSDLIDQLYDEIGDSNDCDYIFAAQCILDEGADDQ